MNRYVQAFLTVMGIVFTVLFGLAMLPLMIALIGSVAGVVVAFLPLVIMIAVIVVLANTVYKK